MFGQQTGAVGSDAIATGIDRLMWNHAEGGQYNQGQLDDKQPVKN